MVKRVGACGFGMKDSRLFRFQSVDNEDVRIEVRVYGHEVMDEESVGFDTEGDWEDAARSKISDWIPGAGEEKDYALLPRGKSADY